MRAVNRRSAVFVALLLIAIVGVALVPIHQNTGDSNVGCGSLFRKDGRELRRQFCEEEGAYEDRERLLLAVTGAGLAISGVVLVVSRSRSRL